MSRLPSLGRRGEGWLALQLLLMALIVGSALILPPQLEGVLRTAAAVLGVVLLVVGLGLVALAARHLGSAATPLPHPTAHAQLVRDGVYRRVRHPIYSGVVLSAAGWALLNASLVALLLVLPLVLLLDLKSRREEAWLQQRFPDYAEYKRRTSRFIPGLY
jgi:protein-S-isoprenylcysteine O-methyltransferase Ste14